ncbi:Flp pilus assembly protein TadG [Sulfitobacter brevis]|uniref:Flp pilus assembly protein TadG n=1 Tax=Sulfitobacter brevis TaxID=74348 RepID=A0A1I1XV09_9RHOB|nr:TadE/TadG family type IV pilus assembly protein [Sulfitobacter brevis]SFE11132.1 Flp pilus assembly protein TadG [Sulfitobacter brevis]
MKLPRILTPIWQDESGAALVEFALLLPMALLFLGLCFEGGRTFWSYQTTISGVRDATRYLSRVVDADICVNGGSTTEWNDKLLEIVRTTQSGATLFPTAVSISAVTSELACIAGSYRGGAAPVATVTANLNIGVPFAGLFSIAGVNVQTIRTSVTDSTRVLGL